MTKSEKSALVEKLSSDFKGAQAIAVCDYKGLSVRELEKLRAEARKQNAKIQVVKNTLAKIALKNAGISGLDFRENNLFAWGEDQIALSKIICKFSESVGGKLVVKSGFYEGEVVDAAQIITISKMPSREELLGMLLSVWMGPARYFVTALDNLRKKQESGE